MTTIRALLLLVAALAPGCFIEGEERHFADESDEVERIHVNAYADTTSSPRLAIVETRGMGADGLPHAFKGTLHVRLERQHNGTGEPWYEPMREWKFEVDSESFTSPTVPYHRHAVGPDAFPTEGTYRARVGATIGGRAVPEGVALFAYAR